MYSFMHLFVHSNGIKSILSLIFLLIPVVPYHVTIFFRIMHSFKHLVFYRFHGSVFHSTRKMAHVQVILMTYL